MSITATRFFLSDPDLLTAEIEDRFFTDLKTRNDTFKRTARDRFQELDARCIRRFGEAGARIATVLDVGVSSGVTTLALAKHLREARHPATVTGTDLSITGFLVPVFPGLRVLADEAGHILQFGVLGRVVRPWRRRADYLTGMLLVRALLRAVSAGRVRRRVAAGDGTLQPVQLLSPRVARDPHVHVEANDVFERTERMIGRFDFIRAANILNRGYFDEAALRRALANLLAYLSGPGAWLLIARSDGRACDATLFRLVEGAGRLVVVDRFGAGSEIEALVLATPLPPQGVAR